MKKQIAFLLIISIMFALIQPLVVSAYEFENIDFGSGTYEDPIRYRDFRDFLAYAYTRLCPTASFEVTIGSNSMNSDETEINADDKATVDNPMYIVVGDIAVITSTSTSSESKYALDMFDWQVTFRAEEKSTYVMKEQSNSSMFSPNTFIFDAPGTYNFYLNVRDNMPHDLVDGWGNWSKDGVHEVIGKNPGSKWNDASDDCYGYWYYAQVQVIVTAEKSYTLQEKHIDTITGTVLSETLHEGISESTFTTTKKNFNNYDFIGSRAGYTWDEIANGTTTNISTRTASFDSSHTIAFHYYYYTKNTPPPPPQQGTADIFIYYKDKITGAAVYPADETTYKGKPYGTYAITALPDTDSYKLDTATTPSPQTVTVDEINDSKTVTFLYLPTELPPANKPPVADVTGPLKKLAGENVVYDGSGSYDSDGTITNYSWEYNGANFISTSSKGDRLTVWYPYAGNYARNEKATLTVTDDTGNTDSDSHSVEILPPVPAASFNITGILKENRRVTLDASASYSPSRYPINNYIWTVVNASNIRAVAALNGNPINDVIFKATGTYSIKVETPNTAGLSDDEQKNVIIIADQNPKANYSTAVKLLRDPVAANKNATITITNLSGSPDGDAIKATVMFYAYDTDNDGNFDEETWYYSNDGTAWQVAGLTYAQLRAGSFDIYTKGTANPQTFTLKTNQVGKYKFECMTMENIPAADTILSLLTPADYRKGNTFTTKPDSEKIVDVINTAPTMSFEVKKKKEVDILVATDYTGQKLANLQAALNVQKAALLAKNIDAKYTIVNSTSAVAHINDKLNVYKRYGRYNYTADYYSWSSSGAGDDDEDLQFTDTVEWESINALQSEAEYLPPRNPANVTWSKTGQLHEEDDSPPINWERYFYNVTINCQNDAKTSGVVKVDTAYYGGLASSSGMTYGHETTNIHAESVSVDSAWCLSETLQDVTVNVNSVNLADITSASLRAGSDRYLLFIGDSSSKIYSGEWGTHFPFGDLTKAELDYLKNNNFKPYIITPSTSLDAALGAEKAKSTIPANGYTFFKAYDGTMKLLFNDGYPADIDLDADIKATYGDYVFLVNDTLKYRVNGAVYTTLASNVTKVIQENGTSDTNLWIVTSDGKLRQFVGGVQKKVLGYSDAVEVYDGSILPGGNGTYIISCASATYFINTNGTAKYLYGAPVSGVKYIGANDVRDGDFVDYCAVFIYKNGYVQLWRIWKDSTYDYSTGISTYFIRDLIATTLYQGIYNSSTNKTTYSGFPWVYPLEGMNCIINNGLYEINGISYIYDSAASKEYYYIDMTNPAYKATGVSNYKDGIIYYINSTLGVPFTYTYYVERWSSKREEYIKTYYTVTNNIDVPELHGKTISKTFFQSGMTVILTSDGKLYKWIAPAVSNIIPTLALTLASNTAQDVYANTYKIYSNYNIVSCTYYYYLDRAVDSLMYLNDNSVIYSNVADVKLTSNGSTLYVVTSDGKLYGQGNDVGSPFHELIKTRIVIDDTTKQYITLRDILNNITDTKYFAAGQYQAAVTDITNTYLNDISYTTGYILAGDTVSYTTSYSDYEKDAKYAENWTYDHNQYYFDNSMGLAAFHRQILTTPVTMFSRKGLYTINAKARDNPKNDNRFDNYKLWSNGNQNLLLYVHEKPVALQRITIANNGNGAFTVKALDAGSYDPDHDVSRADKGITAREWRWKESTSTAWTAGQMNKADCTADKSYITQLRVKDLEEVWSDYNTITIDRDNPPAALFNIEKNIISTAEYLKVRDQSFPQSFSTITGWYWIVNKVNADGSETNIYAKTAAESNTGTGSLEGYDKYVKYSYSSTGKYRVYLRVKDSNGLWSDCGTDSAYNLNSFYSQKFEVDSPPEASFVIEKNPIFVEETLKLKDQSTVTGISPIIRWHWIVKKLNQDGSVPSANIQDDKFSDSNTGTGAMAGYDVNVKTLYTDKGAGTYRIYLRVMNGNGMWSDGGTESSYNLNNFFHRDLEVQESFKISNFRIVKIRDLHLEPYYYDDGKYEDRPFYVNDMAIDPSNFIVGGISLVPGFSSLTKGYRFEFEIDTTNFNETNDTIVITPSFFSYTRGVPGVRGQETDLYWEDSNKNIYKAGEGAHSKWAVITLNGSNRTITGENSATWRGEYLIPATSWLVRPGTSIRINADIIVNFNINGYKDGVMKYDYNLQQWPVERTYEKYPYEIGDVIRYDYTKSSLDDKNTIINRP